MASCDDDFSLIGDDQTNPNHHHHHHQHVLHQPYAPRRFNPKPSPIHAPPPPVESLGNQGGNAEEDENDVVVQTSSAFHGVNPFSAEESSNPFGGAAVDGADPSRSRIVGGVRSEKRQNQEELSDGGTASGAETTPYGLKRSRCSLSEYRKDREEWSDAAISCLLDAYSEKFTQLNRGNLRGRDWDEVAAAVSERCDKQSKTVEQCKNKIDNLKKRYKLERHRMSNGGVSTSHWPWFKKMEEIVGNSLTVKSAAEEERGPNSSASAARQPRRYPTAMGNPGLQITNTKPKSMPNPRWRRVVLKISGAALACTGSSNIDPKVVMVIAKEVAMACKVGVEIAMVVGSRNLFCGDTWAASTGLDKSTTYQISMMASVMNSILLQTSLEKMGIQSRLQTTFGVQEIAEPFNRQRAIRHLEKGRVVIFGGVGVGPLSSTDTAAALRASEIHADAVLKGTNVDGVYDCHSQDGNATFEHISFRDLASRGLTSMDAMALSYCEENGIPVVVFNFLEPGNILKALCGDQVGTLIDRTGRIS